MTAARWYLVLTALPWRASDGSVLEYEAWISSVRRPRSRAVALLWLACRGVGLPHRTPPVPVRPPPGSSPVRLHTRSIPSSTALGASNCLCSRKGGLTWTAVPPASTPRCASVGCAAIWWCVQGTAVRYRPCANTLGVPRPTRTLLHDLAHATDRNVDREFVSAAAPVGVHAARSPGAFSPATRVLAGANACGVCVQ